MVYDFETIPDRRGKDAVAIDAPAAGMSDGFFPVTKIRDGFSIIPMWIADMNFATAPSVTAEIKRRAEHPLYGYFLPPAGYFDAIRFWQRERNGVEELPDACIGYENSVLGGMVTALRVLCSGGDPILLHAPTYIGFTHCLEDNGWKIVLSPLCRDEQGIWRMDYEDMEKKIAEHHIHATVFCSPHNPSGRVWERWEIERAMEIFKKYDVYVISDEIWSDLTMPGHRHIPTQAVSEDAKNRTVALYAPSKTFNLAGLVGAYHIIYQPWLRDRIRKDAKMTRYNHMNVLSMHALIGAYSREGAQWTDALRGVIEGNLRCAVEFVRGHFPGVEADMPEGTYMLMLDCSAWCREHDTDIETLLKRGISVGVIWQDGRAFHGPCHIRMNLALPRHQLEEALRRLEQYVF